jgi:nucleosome binding factor SPN SPT16 subunit
LVPEKGAEPMVKWIIPSMVDVVKKAINQIREQTKEARKEFSKNNPMHNKKAKDKMQKTNLKKYGCISSFGNKKVQKKIRDTNVEKYGVK